MTPSTDGNDWTTWSARAVATWMLAMTVVAGALVVVVPVFLVLRILRRG